jgi:putative restriction endonuclease
MRYWWVNHKQTSRQELGGGYLWAPKREANGARSQFYDNMRIAEPGDIVLSFSAGVIGNVGVVQDFASPALKPDGFGTTGENWSNDGWLLPVKWQPLTAPVRPKDRIRELGPLLPTKYSPIHPVSGNGNQKAYLAEIGRPVFELLIGSNDFEHAITLQVPDEDISALMRVDDTVEKVITEDPGIDTTTKKQLVLARRGQGIFRSRVLEFERTCPLTSVETPQLLIASHIKPWRVCGTAAERLDGANGLLLAPHVDRLFDRGLISFGDDGEVLVSSRLAPLELRRLGLHDACAKGCRPFHARQANYLAFHRANVLL